MSKNKDKNKKLHYDKQMSDAKRVVHEKNHQQFISGQRRAEDFSYFKGADIKINWDDLGKGITTLKYK